MTAQSPILTPLAVENAEVLHALRHAMFDTPTELAKRLDRDPSNMRRTLKSLEAAGLVLWPSLTEAGYAAHDAIQRAESPNAPPPRTNTGDILMLRHDQMRPNPKQPREVDESDPDQSRKLDELAATIHAANDVLQNLVVFPAGADGFHEISAGERRWRAVGRLIEAGQWPADRPLRAVQTEAVMGQAEFVALIENGQREGLHPVEEMKAYAQLIESRDLSARQAALETGRDVRTVQEMMKVWREADRDDIEACRRGELTWEQLRNSVKEAKAPPPAPIQADIEDIAPAQPTQPAEPYPIIGGAGAGASMPPKPIADPAAPDAVLTPVQSRTMAELDLILTTRPTGFATDGTPYVACGKYWLDNVAAELKALRLVVFMHTGGIFAALTQAGRAWCEDSLAECLTTSDPILTPWLKATDDGEVDPPHVAADLTAPPVAAADKAEADRQALVAAATPSPEQVLGRWITMAADNFVDAMTEALRDMRQTEDFDWDKADCPTLAGRLMTACQDGQTALVGGLAAALYRRGGDVFSEAALIGAHDHHVEFASGKTIREATREEEEA